MTEAGDSIVWQPFHSTVPETAAPASTREMATMRPARVEYIDGIQPGSRSILPGYDSGITCLLLCLFLFVAYNFQHYSSYLRMLWGELTSVRRRANVFDDRSASESRLMLSLVVVTCVSESILLFSLVYNPAGVASPIRILAPILGVTALFYMVQLAAYSTVGWVFTDRENSGQWLKGFNSSQALLGISLILPALFTLFYPAASAMMAGLGCLLYVLARGIFIIKGFRIFYTDLFSWVYFILYLCTLEIAPLVMLYRGVKLIYSV